MLSPKQQAELFTKLLKEHFGDRLVSVVLFGSVGRGDARPESDIDLIVVLKDLPSGRLARRDLLDPVHERYAKNRGSAFVNSHLKTPEEAKKITVMYFDLPTDGKILFDRDNFFRTIIEDVSQKIRETGAVRMRIGRFRYWDLHPGRRGDEVFDIL